MADEGKNIRSVIKNTTMGGMSVKGKGNTIATKDEIKQSKEKPGTPKINFGPKIGLQTPGLGGLVGGLNLKRAQSTGKSEVVSQPKVEKGGQSMVGGMSVRQQTPVSSPFQNQMNEPINNVNVEQFNNESILKRPTELNLKMGEKPITARLRELDKERNKRMSKGIENLYIDAYNKGVDGGMLTIEDVLGNKNYQQQLKGIDEKMLAEMIDDANYLAQGDYDTQNVLALMDKYKDLGLKMDLDNLPPQTKAQYIAANLEGNDGGLGGVIDHISPLNIPGEIIERAGGTNPRDYNEKLQQWAQENKHDFLSDEELKYTTQDFVKNLDKEYKDYYYNQTEEMFTDKRIGKQFYEDVAKLRKQNKGMSEEEAVAKVMKEGKYNNLPYEKFQHETVDQGRFWKDKNKEKEYNKRLKEIEGKAKEAHGDTTANWFKNLGLDATLVVGQGLDLVRNPGSLASGLASAVKGAGHKAIEGYADLLDTVIATAETVVDKDKKWEGIQYRVGEVGEKVAKKKGYENYDAMVQKMEQASEDNPGLKVATWFLKQGQQDLGTANAFGDYLTNAYGSWDRVEQTAKENPVQMASDVISIIQLGTMGAAKMGLIDANKANQIVKVAGYGDLYEQTLKWGNKLQFGPVLRGEMAVAKAGAKVAGAPFKVAKNFTEVFVNKLSGLTKEERDFIKQNPEKVEEFLKGDKNSQSLLDRIIERFDGLQLEKRLEGEEYEKIKNSNTPVKISDMLSSISERLKKGGLELTNEGVRVNKNYTPAINSKFTELGEFLDELRKKGNSATAEDVRWARRQIDTLAKWEGQPAGLEADAIGLIRDIRGILDAELKRQIPDMKVLDDSYRATIAEVKEMKKDWFNKDGTLKDSAYSRIRNLTNKGSNQPKLARLERLLPGISEELRGLAVAESVEKAGKQMVGQYANQIFGVGGGIVGITSLLSGGLSAGPIILGVLGATLATPKNLVKLLKYQGKISNGFNKIISKITNGIKLTPAETQEFTKYLNDNQRELGKDARYMYEKGLITDEEYKAALEKEEKDYNMAVDKARASVGDKEKTLKGKEGKKVIEDTKKKAKNIGFVTEIEKGLKDENGGKVLGLADVKNKIIKLSKNLTDTTAQHELFHAVMSVVDGETRKYVIDEAKKILKDRGISDVNAEEWLAESFGVYAKRKQVNLGVLDKVKWGDGKIRAVIGDLFQRVYEWLQNYNGDRKTINKLFDEILDDKVKIGENGGVDLSYLLEGKDLEGKGLKGKDGLRYKKDLSNKDSRGRSLSEGQAEYFKNSKARDKDGNLIRVYHGTSNKFNVFDENKIDKKGNYFGAGFYFTDDVESAGAYGGLVKEGYLNIEKVFDMSKYYTEAEYNGLLKELGLSKDELPAYKTKEGEYHLVSGYERDTFRRMGDNSYNFDGERLAEALKKAGYDGIMGEIGDEREFVVFNSNQFKNVDNLNPTKSEDIRYKKARHGSPASFDKFDSSHMGEGEGAQAHGWGHYVAVEERTGRHYAGMGGEPKNEATYKGKTIAEHSFEEAKAERGKMAIMGKMEEGKSFEDAKKIVLDEYKGYVKGRKELLKNGNWDKVWWDEKKLQKAIKEGEHIIETAEDAKKSDFKVETRTQRNLYELEIPDPVKRDTPTGSNYLDEDKYYSKAEVKKFLGAMKNIDSGWLKDTKESRIYDLYKKGLDIRGKDLYDMLAYAKGDKQASKFLESLGYDGIHYYGGRDGEAYVLFNDDAPQIQNHIRYKKAKDSNMDGIGEGNGEKELKMTGKWEKNEYNNKDNLDINQKNKDGVIKESKNDTGKGEKNLGGLAKKEESIKQGGNGEGVSGKAWNNGGGISQEDGGFLELNTDGEKVVANLEKIKASNPDGFKMDIHGSADYGNGKRKTFQSKDGMSSITIKDDGDITSLVSKPGGGRGKNLVLTAIKNGGDKLDCYADFLPEFYQKAGFEPVARVKFNPEYAPADWKGKGQDIIVMMRRNNDSVEKVNENWGKYEVQSLNDLPVMEYDDALAYRDMLLEERKKSYKPRKVETVQETPNGLKKKKEWIGPNKPIWEETINKDTGKPYTAEEVDAKMNKIKDKYLNDKNKLRKLYNKYVEVNDELGEDLQNTFMKDGYLNPDGLRPLINKEFAREMGVGDNVMASTNHPAVSKIADAFVEMVGDDMIEKASKGEKVNVALIGGGGGSGKSGGPKAMISEGFVKDGEKVNMTLDVQGGANDLKKLVEKAREKGVLDKFNFKIAYVYASTEDAGKGVINRTINQNQRILEKQGLSPKVVEKETDIGKNRLYAGRTLPFEVFEQGHLKSVGEKGLRGYIDIAKDIDNVEFMITERVPGDKKNTNKYIVKQGGEWKMTEKELNDLVTRMTKNKEAGLNWAELEKEGQKAVKEGKISKRQYANLFGRLGAFAFLLMVVGGGNGEEA